MGLSMHWIRFAIIITILWYFALYYHSNTLKPMDFIKSYPNINYLEDQGLRKDNHLPF